MPPKKDKQQEPPQKVINFYERMDKKFLDNAENPNFHLHHLKVPFRMCIVAPSGSGKTNFLLNIIHLFSQGKGTFADLSIITRNKDEPLYRFLQSKNDQINIKEGLENLLETKGFEDMEVAFGVKYKSDNLSDAEKNQCFVAGVNRTGSDPGYSFPGSSVCVDWNGDALAESGSELGVTTAALDIDGLNVYRTALPFLKSI